MYIHSYVYTQNLLEWRENQNSFAGRQESCILIKGDLCTSYKESCKHDKQALYGSRRIHWNGVKTRLLSLVEYSLKSAVYVPKEPYADGNNSALYMCIYAHTHTHSKNWNGA